MPGHRLWMVLYRVLTLKLDSLDSDCFIKAVQFGQPFFCRFINLEYSVGTRFISKFFEWTEKFIFKYPNGRIFLMPNEMINKAIEICRKHGVTRLILFGSAVHNLENAQDIDLAVEGVEGWGLIELAAEIENNLMINVDVVPIEGNSRFMNHVLPKSKVLYA